LEGNAGRLFEVRFKAFDKLGRDVKQVIFDLARDQKFKCALCSKRSELIIEHEHEPKEKIPCTIYNIRGLVCGRCNKALMGCDMEECGYFTNWENGYPYLSSDDYQDYKDRFEGRVDALREALLKKRVPNYWHRRLALDKFDDWFYEGGQPPLWHRKYKEQESRKIETPEDFIRGLAAIMQFINEQFKNDPNFEPPEEFLKLMVRIRPIIEEALPFREQT
jgi:hypothetical protein